MRLAGHGLAIDLPPRWEGTITRSGPPVGATAADLTAQHLPMAHLATFGLPADRGDFGSGAVDLMGPADCFVAVLEYGPECAGTALFAPKAALPQLRTSQFGTNRLQRTMQGQAGAQVFCTVGGRAFCVYAVLGSAARTATLVPEVNRVLAATAVAVR
jgi:hypothetical protein